ncbi:hypothetical protein ASPFODRAFT_148500 [Aspergillus luchuensis CBS 106.47]|uniref:Uncharacterized protein n=1 Tax=Aspergillus luchuensis (strain CBS 106.47) TaxID=1137211 RepID=A0A1M3SZF3_ASPLC|nr:hypothetical protein ASPFODRAFT_148500 [Aspergillus luchuensis CBS 106.47]
MKISLVATVTATLAALASAQDWPCDAGTQCGATIIARDEGWVAKLKLAEINAGRAGLDPLWDLFQCNGDGSVKWLAQCPGQCVYGGAGQDYCTE